MDGLDSGRAYIASVSATNASGSSASAMLPYRFYPVAAKSLTLDAVAGDIVRPKKSFPLLAYGVAAGSVVEFAAPTGRRGCQATPAQQCATTFSVARTGIWSFSASYGESKARMMIYAPSVTAPGSVRRNKTFLLSATYLPPRAKVTVTAGSKTFKGTASSQGKLTIRVRLMDAGRESLHVFVNGVSLETVTLAVR
jgi:hypothetical protein